jgi:hypothetical protein
MVSQKLNKGVKILKIEEKVRILAWAEEGVLVKEIATRMGHHWSASIECCPNPKGFPSLPSLVLKRNYSTRPRN